MTTLVFDTLQTELTQEINYNLNERLHVGAFIPYLYVHNAPAGVFNFKLSNQAGVIFEKNFTSQDIKESLSTSDNFMHVYYPIIPDNPVQLDRGSFTVTIEAVSGYAAGMSYIGWIKQHENIQNDMEYIPENDNFNSYTIRYKSLVEGIQL